MFSILIGLHNKSLYACILCFLFKISPEYTKSVRETTVSPHRYHSHSEVFPCDEERGGKGDTCRLAIFPAGD